MKFRNDPSMTWSSSDGDGGGMVVVDPTDSGDSEVCLRFDRASFENVSLKELSRASTAALLNGGGEKRSIETSAHDVCEAPRSLGKNATGRDHSVARVSRGALQNGHATGTLVDASVVPQTDNLQCVRAVSDRERLSDESTSLTASNGYAGWFSMSQVAPLEPPDSDAAPTDEPTNPREEASGCSSSSSDEDGQQRRSDQSDANKDADVVDKEKEVCRESVAAEDDHEPKDQEVTPELPASQDAPDVAEPKGKKRARKSVRFSDDPVDAQEEKGDDSDASSTRERPDGASSEESVDAEGPKETVSDADQDGSDEENGEQTLKPKGILKRPADKGKRKNRVTFNELMTVFADGYPEVQVPAFRPWDLTDILCFAYEPPPGYRDWDAFDPPAEYMDLVEASMGVTTFHGEDDAEDNNEGKVSADEMMEIYRTEFEYSADAVDEPNDFPVVKVDYSFDTSEILENQEIASTLEDVGDTEKIADVEKEEEATTPPEENPAQPLEDNTQGETEVEDDESPLDSPIRDDDDSISVDEPSRYGRKHGAVTDNEDSGPDADDLSGDESKDSSGPSTTIEIKPLDFKSSESEAESGDQPLTPTTEKELESGDEYHNAASKMMARTNSQIRKSIEMNALRRSLLKGSDVCRRRNPSGGSASAQRPKSPITSSLEEKLRWLTSTEDLTMANEYLEPREEFIEDEKEEPARESTIVSDVNPHPPGPPRQNFPPPHYVIQPRPTRWSSELLYTSPAPSASSASSSSSSTGSSYDNRPQLPSFRPPPTRPCSFDPTMGALAWEGYLQRDKYAYGGSSLSVMRAPYVCTVERHPNAANYPGNAGGGPNGSRGPRDPNNPTSDELEWFVQRDLERIERIKKRYSLTEEDDPTFGFGRRPSVRGIRPRFGSTSEILQQLQAQMRPPRPFSTANVRPPWPGPNGIPRAQMGPRPNQGQYPVRQHHPQQPYQQPTPHQQNYYGPPVQQPNQANHPRTVVVLPRVSEEGGPLPHIVRVRSKHDHAFLIPNGVLFGQTKGQSMSSVKDERGAPEGASSSPKVSSDSLYPHQQQAPPRQSAPGAVPNAQRTQPTNTTDTNQKEAVIYYSLRV